MRTTFLSMARSLKSKVSVAKSSLHKQSLQLNALSYSSKFAFSSSDKYSKETMDSLKKKAQAFYENEVAKETQNNKAIFDITEQDQWQTEVLDSPIPVVLDCYANWCQPCKKLTPVLEDQAAQAQGKWKLVKLDIDKFPQLATALQIQSIPTVYIISNKNAIDGFVGTPSEQDLKRFFETVKNISGLAPQDNEIKEKIALAQTFIDSNTQLQEAIGIITTLLDSEVNRNKFGGQLYGMLGLIAASQGNTQDALKHLNEIKTKYSDEAKTELVAGYVTKIEETLQQLKKKLSADPEIEVLKLDAAQNPTDLTKLFNLAQYQVNKNLYEDAIENLFTIIKIDRNWESKKANKLLIDTFTQLGASHALTVAGRKRLQKLLF